jgi:hypothetical protein
MSQEINNKKYQCLCRELPFISDEELQKHIDERKDINDF